MRREEAILAATIAINDINQRANLGIVRGAPTGHKGFYDFVVKRTCYQDAQPSTQQHIQQTAEIIVILHHHIEQRQIERYPCKTVGKRAHHTVEEQRIAAVNGQQ